MTDPVTPTPTALSLKISNDNYLTLSGLQDALDTANYINDAVVTVTIVDADGGELAGETWPLTMSYVSASNGVYRVKLPYTLSGLTDNDLLTAQITATGGGLRGYWAVPVQAEDREL